MVAEMKTASEKLRVLAKSATPGPWKAELSECDAHDDGSDEWIVWQSADKMSDSTMLIEGDARFIASMRDVIEEISELLEISAGWAEHIPDTFAAPWINRYAKLGEMLPDVEKQEDGTENTRRKPS